MTEQQKYKKAGEPAQKGGSKLAIFLALLALVSAGASMAAAAYLWLQQQNIHSDMRAQSSDQSMTLADFGSRLTQVTTLADQNKAQSEQVITTTKALDERVIALAHEVSSITGLNRVDWQVAQAEHLLRAAHQRLVLTGDVEGAYALLDAADKVMGDIKEIGTINVRRAFAKDLNALHVAGRVDMEGIFVKLDALKEHITKLTLPPLQWQANKAEIKPVSKDADWSEKVVTTARNLFEVIGEQYQIQQLDEPVKPLLSSEQRVYLSQNLELLIEQAQLAAMKHDAVVYKRVLAQAESWVRQHFNLDTADAELTLTTFKELSAIELNPSVPGVEESMRALKVFSEAWSKEKEIRQASVGKELDKAPIDASVPAQSENLSQPVASPEPQKEPAA